MATFRVSVFNQNGRWFFQWDNVDVHTVCDVTGPLDSKEEAEAEKQRFMDTEKQKRPWVVFESV